MKDLKLALVMIGLSLGSFFFLDAAAVDLTITRDAFDAGFYMLFENQDGTNQMWVDTDGFVFANGSLITTINNTASNIGHGVGSPFFQQLLNDLEFRGIAAGDNVTITQNGTDIIISSAGGIDTTINNTGSNVGHGIGSVFLQKILNDLQFRGIAAGSNVIITQNGTDILINSIDTDTTINNTASNIGHGVGSVFAQKLLNDLEFRGIAAGSNITITQNATDIIISSTGGGGGGINNTASNIGHGVGSVFFQQLLNDLQLRGIAAGDNVTITQNATDIIKSNILAIIDIDEINIRELNIIEGNFTENTTAFNRVEDSAVASAYVAWEALQLVSGTYIFNLMILFGMPVVLVAIMTIVYVFLLGYFIWTAVRGT